MTLDEKYGREALHRILSDPEKIYDIIWDADFLAHISNKPLPTIPRAQELSAKLERIQRLVPPNMCVAFILLIDVLMPVSIIKFAIGLAEWWLASLALRLQPTDPKVSKALVDLAIQGMTKALVFEDPRTPGIKEFVTTHVRWGDVLAEFVCAHAGMDVQAMDPKDQLANVRKCVETRGLLHKRMNPA